MEASLFMRAENTLKLRKVEKFGGSNSSSLKSNSRRLSKGVDGKFGRGPRRRLPAKETKTMFGQLAPSSVGKVPLSSLSFKLRLVSAGRCSQVEGKEPLKRLWAKFKFSKFCKRPSASGICPVRLLLSALKEVRSVNRAILLGTDPESALFCNSMILSFDAFPSVSGIDPVQSPLLRDRVVSEGREKRSKGMGVRK